MITGIFNLKNKNLAVPVELEDGEYVNILTGDNISVNDGMIDTTLCPIIIA